MSWESQRSLDIGSGNERAPPCILTRRCTWQPLCAPQAFDRTHREYGLLSPTHAGGLSGRPQVESFDIC